MEFTIDLVFEHANPLDRRALRQLDEQRWARTAISRGDDDEAREAFAMICEWHAERDLRFGSTGDGGLRTAADAVEAIVRRWPEVVTEPRARFESDSRSTDVAVAVRALCVLGALDPDDRTTEWLLPCLEGTRPLITATAAGLAGRLRVHEAIPRLREHLGSAERDVRRAALRALVELVPAGELPDVARAVKDHDGLRPVARRLLERVHVDTGIAVAQSESQLSPTSVWLLERIINEAHPNAWTASRVANLMRVCESVGGVIPDAERLAGVLIQHP